MKIPALFTALFAFLLAGCIQQNPAQTKVYTPYGVVKYHCPPGQAKKGRCHSGHW